MSLSVIIETIFLGLSLGMFGFTGEAMFAWFLSSSLFYIGWMIIHNWREKNGK